MTSKIAEAYASTRLHINGAVLDARDRIADSKATLEGFTDAALLLRRSAPTLTTGLLIAVLLLGGVGGWQASAWWTRWGINAEWRAKLAASSKAADAIVNQGNREGEQVDNDVIKAIGETDAKLEEANRKLAEFERNARATPAGPAAPAFDRCTVPADCLRQR